MEHRISRSRSLITTSSLNPFLVCFHRHLVKPSLRSQCLPARISTLSLSCIYRHGFHRSTFEVLPSLLKTPCPVLFPSTVHRLRCVGNTTSPFASTGGDGGCGGECGSGGEGGGDGSDSGDAMSNSAAAGVEDASSASSDVIILDVGVSITFSLPLYVKRIRLDVRVDGSFVLLNYSNAVCQGMTCGGCTASVKRILENQVSAVTLLPSITSYHIELSDAIFHLQLEPIAPLLFYWKERII